MIVIQLHRNGEIRAEAEAETPEAALLAARTLWDDERAAFPIQGSARATTTYFLIEGKCSALVEGRRP